jgi:D-tyrosyl-tRNA(Tyr) deacylase
VQIVLQKVTSASVTVDPSTGSGQARETIASIDRGYLILVGIAHGDTDAACAWLAEKVSKLRLFPGDPSTGSGQAGKINDRTVTDVGGSAIIVSQFTLLGSVEGSNRPDYTRAAPKEEAERLYLLFAERLKEQGIANVQTGRFGAAMAVESVNDGPVTLLIGK